MSDLMQIGDFARLGGVSVKTLRHYEDRGLLAPAWVDPSSGYRFYTLEQADRLARIVTLRLVDFSLTEIAALLEGDDFDDPLQERITALDQAQQALIQKRAIADIIRRIRPDIRIEDLKLAPIDEALVYSVEAAPPHLGDPITEIFETAEKEVAGARADAAPFMIFHSDPAAAAPLHIEVCIPVEDHAEGMAGVKRTPGATLSCGHIYAGGYHQTETAYTAMKDLLERSALKPSGPLREIYHRFGADCDDYSLPSRRLTRSSEQFLTELRLPIALIT